MKKFILLFALASMFVSTYAHSISSNKVPSVIKSNFVSKYPDAEVIRWESTAYLDYKVEFKVGDDYGAAFYDSTGKFIEDDRTVEWSQVPLTGRMEIYHLGKNKIMNVLKITNAKKETYYQVDVKNNFKVRQVILDAEGNILRKL